LYIKKYTSGSEDLFSANSTLQNGALTCLAEVLTKADFTRLRRWLRRGDTVAAQ